MTVYFIGGGPGDPELLTLKARKAIEKADIVLYAGSLISPRLLEFSKPGAELIDSSPLDLEGLQAVFLRAGREGKDVARIHSGDLSLYSAAQEQMDWCQENAVDFVAIPGVSSFSAACASLHQELTLPGVSQTVILTRLAGRTPVPSREDLAKLAGIGASMVIFLSVQRIEEVVDKLKKAYPLTTPVAVVERASWPEEAIIRGNLEDIESKVKRAKIRRTALIIVGQVLNKKYRKSRLYAADFEHAFRGLSFPRSLSSRKRGAGIQNALLRTQQ